MQRLENLAHFKRYIWSDAGLLIVSGEIGPVMSGMGVYNSRHGISPLDPDRVPMAEGLLLATSLAAVSLAERESWGVSVTFPGREEGFFVGAEPEGMLCIRTQTAQSNRSMAVFQRQKAGEPMTQSTIVPKSNDPTELVAQYFDHAVQTESRLTIRDNRGVLVQALPGGNFESVSSKPPDGLFDLVESALAKTGLKDVGEVLQFYECRCSRERIIDTIERMESSHHNELWGDAVEIEVECPRCGREYTLRRNQRSGM